MRKKKKKERIVDCLFTGGEENGIAGENVAEYVAADKGKHVRTVASQMSHTKTRRIWKEVIDHVNVRLLEAPPTAHLSRLLWNKWLTLVSNNRFELNNLRFNSSNRSIFTS